MLHPQSPLGNAGLRSKRDGDNWCSQRSQDYLRCSPLASASPDRASWRQESKQVDSEDSIVERMKGLPASTGLILMAAGVVGVILPGPMGAPLLPTGGCVLAPNLFGKLDAYLKTRCPGVRHQGVKMLGRFLDDLERRYPDDQAQPRSRTSGTDTRGRR